MMKPNTLRLVILALCAVLVTACESPYALLFPQQHSVRNRISSEQRIIAPHLGARLVTACLDVTSSYPRSYFQAAKMALADALYSAVQLNQDGVKGYVTLINHNSYDPASTIAAITVPPLPPDPLPPSLLPMPTTSADPYASAKETARVTTINEQRQQDYQTALLQSHRTLASTREQVRKQTDLLKSSNPPADAVQTDIWGCLERQAQRLHDASISGKAVERYLFIASDGVNNTSFDQTTLDLSSVHVRFIWFYCQSAPSCTESYWLAALKQAGATDITFSDPSESQSSTLGLL